ncbi:hypothetical protein J2D78_04185 [Microbacterium maritypicum]|uniref:hypothetical protein n=1 Tax=Microbacterium maritypicum TaxID=33918 RepID=UPI001B32805C|nr:hypothetical protein [Microbacterium liquefaciens]MBP5801277.1 hypothetical protein [Microbacterium liquefaciens]
MSNTLAIALAGGDTRIVVFNAARGLPAPDDLVALATEAGAEIITLLHFSTDHLRAETVKRWVQTSSDQLRTAGVHLASFNADLGLALGHPLVLAAGLHPVAPHMWLIVRRWTPPRRSAAQPVVTFVGPSAVQREGLHGSLWADELLKPEDLAAIPISDVIVADLEGDLTSPARRTPEARHPSMLHPFLGRAVVQRASARVVWAAAPEGAPRSPGRVRPGEHAVVRLGDRN